MVRLEEKSNKKKDYHLNKIKLPSQNLNSMKNISSCALLRRPKNRLTHKINKEINDPIDEDQTKDKEEC